MPTILLALAVSTIVLSLSPASVLASQELGASSASQPLAGGAAESAALRARGLEQGFNLDYTDALETFRHAIAADSTHPASYRLVAATVWIHLLFQQGAVTVDDFLGQARSTLPRTPPPPDLARMFHENLSRALSLGEQRLRDNRHDADAHYQVGASAGILTSYTATVEGRVRGSFGAARRAFNEHEQVLRLDPRRKDAGLIVGMYRYAVSSLPAPLRLVARMVGFGGGRERGLRLVEEAAQYSSHAQTDALFTLIVMYTREGRFDEALRVIGQLQARYPRNRLLWLEAGSTALRAGRPAAAREALEQGLVMLGADERPRAFGEQARWWYYHGAALVALGEVETAQRELRQALAVKAQDWVHGRTHVELGKIADRAGHRQQAVEEYRVGKRLCEAGHDVVCAREASRFMADGYR